MLSLNGAAALETAQFMAERIDKFGTPEAYNHYAVGWAHAMHSTPWAFGGQLPAYDDDVWELYAPDDWTQAHDIARRNPQRLQELQRLFLIEAVKYQVLSLDDRRVERFNPGMAGRP